VPTGGGGGGGGGGSGLSNLAQQVANAREQIQISLQSLKFHSPAHNSSGGAVEDPEMREENALLKKKLENLENQVKQLTDRVVKLESGSGDSNRTVSAPPKKVEAAPKKVEDDDDVDLFGSEDEVSGSGSAECNVLLSDGIWYPFN
jgi:predicted transcriptional regulator